MKSTYYFSHDYTARQDEKIINLLIDLGYEGYGIFWAVIELLYQNDGYFINKCDRIAFAIQAESDIVKKVVSKYDLFKFNDQYIYSDSILDRLDQRNEKSDKARESALKRWSKHKRDANALRSGSGRNAIKESKVKESKVKESKANIPTFVEFKNYALKNKKDVNLEFLELKYKSWVANNWKDGHNKKITNWKSKLLNTLPHLKTEEIPSKKSKLYKPDQSKF